MSDRIKNLLTGCPHCDHSRRNACERVKWILDEEQGFPRVNRKGIPSSKKPHDQKCPLSERSLKGISSDRQRELREKFRSELKGLALSMTASTPGQQTLPFRINARDSIERRGMGSGGSVCDPVFQRSKRARHCDPRARASSIRSSKRRCDEVQIVGFEKSGAWSCSRCTFGNSRSQATCEMCSSKRPGSASAGSSADNPVILD